MIRGRVISVLEGVIKRFTASGRSDENIANREYLQHYGFTSRPLAGAELVILNEGGSFLAVASDDRRYRLAIGEGEVALYDDQGQRVHLTRDGIVAQSPVKITAIAPEVAIVAEAKVTVTSPLVAISGDLTVGGTAAVQGALSSATSVADPNGTMQGMRDIHNAHTHPHPSDGQPIPAPEQQM